MQIRLHPLENTAQKIKFPIKDFRRMKLHSTYTSIFVL